jgi:hypothetical protein
MADESRPGRCWYCGAESLRAGDPPEHIIPEAMGGTLKTDRVCRGCNERAGKAIDAPFMRDWLIAMDRALHSPRGGLLQPRVDATLDDGTPVDLGTGQGPWKATVRAAIEWKGDEVIIRASNRAEYEKLLGRVRRKVEEEGREFVDPGEPTEVADSGLIVVRTKLDGVIWLRMAPRSLWGASPSFSMRVGLIPPTLRSTRDGCGTSSPSTRTGRLPWGYRAALQSSIIMCSLHPSTFSISLHSAPGKSV